MGLIKILEEHVLEEGRFENAIDKFAKSEQDQEIIKYLSDNDPSGNNKYLNWMGDKVINNNDSKEFVVSLIKDFHQMVNKITPEVVREVFDENNINEKVKKMLSAPTNINSYENVKDLSKVVDLAKQMLSRREIKKLAKSEAETIYEDDIYEILVPRTYRASCHYGTGTKWCVTSRDSDIQFRGHINRGVLFFVLDKKIRTQVHNPLYKIAVFYTEDSNKPTIYNALDQTIGNNNLNNIFPSNMVNAIKTYMDKRKIVFKIIDNNLLKKTKLNITDNRWVPIDSEDFNDLKLRDEETGSIVTFDINSKKNIIKIILSYHGTTIQTLNEELDLSLIKSIKKFINFETQSFKTVPEIQTKINNWISGVANKVIDSFNGTLNMLKVGKILEQMAESNNNTITGNFEGNWIFEVTRRPTFNRPISEIKIAWPEDPDDDVLNLNCSINFNDNTFSFSGVLNPGTALREDYDDEIENFDSELKNTPQELVDLFFSWIKKLMYCLINENSDSDSECAKYLSKE